MQQEELEKKVRHIQIHSRKAVVEVLAGEYKSKFKGMGIEFEDVRDYQHGDDVRMIDWNVTARTGKPHVKQFMEERELTLYFLIDVSGSGDFGSGKYTKNDVSAQVFALLAFAASHNNDNVGLILFSDQIEFFVKPGKGKKHVMYMIHKILGHKPKSHGTSIRTALEFLAKVRRNRCVSFLFSDFIDDGYQDLLRELARRHDMVCVTVSDRRERELPNSGMLELVDAETGDVQTIDCGNAALRERLVEQTRSRQKELLEFCLESDIDILSLCTAEDYLNRIILFFRARKDRSADAK